MEAHIGDNKIVITIKPKTFYFDLSKDVDNNLKDEMDPIIKHNDFLAEHAVKTRLVYCCSNIIMETISINTKNSKSNEPKNIVLNLSQRLDL